MKRRRSPLFWFLMLLAVAAAGCGWWYSDDDEPAADPVPELGASTVPPPPQPSQPPGEPQPLQLNVGPGYRFPLMKTVDQTLVQASQYGPVTSQSRLELLLAITVEEAQQDRRRLGVQYHRVRYLQNVAGEAVQFDSSLPQSEKPVLARAYDGLINNGFSFWIGPDNQIMELVGFSSFLERCVKDVPVAERQAVVERLAEMSGDEGIANFVDDSIGLLPYHIDGARPGSGVKVGDAWTRERRFTRPVPLYLNSRCTLNRLTDRVAEIDIVGNIASTSPYAPTGPENQDMRVTVRGGHTIGNCTIDRATGLPINSHIERFFDMTVEFADGRKIEQQKKVVTTIRAFPAGSNAPGAAVQTVAEPPAGDTLRKAEFSTPTPHR